MMEGLKSNSNLEKITSKGDFAVTCDFNLTTNVDIDDIKRNANILKSYIDAVNILDNPNASVGISAIAKSVILMQEGIEPILQINVRDRNRIALQSDVLGAGVLGIKNIMCISGDHQIKGDFKQTKNVYDIDSIQFILAIKKIRDEKKLLNNLEIEKSPSIFIGALSGPFNEPLGIRILRLGKKISAGANFIQTLGIFDIDKFSKWMEKVRRKGYHEKVKIFASVIPLQSVEEALELKENFSGIEIPDEIIKRLKDAKEPQKEGIMIAQELIKNLKQISGIAGVHIISKNLNLVPDIIKGAGLIPRPNI